MTAVCGSSNDDSDGGGANGCDELRLQGLGEFARARAVVSHRAWYASGTCENNASTIVARLLFGGYVGGGAEPVHHKLSYGFLRH